MNDSVFGKTMENIRNHKDVKLLTSNKKYLKYVMKPNFKDVHPFSKHYLLWKWEMDRLTQASVPLAGNISPEQKH